MSTPAQNFETMRHAMVDSQLRTSDVTNRAIVAAMATVPRENFVPAGRASVAYHDRTIPLGGGRGLNPPLTVGQMLVAANVRAGEKVLIIGANMGYSAALLSEMDTDVTALESEGNLLAHAKRALKNAANVTFAQGDLAKGYSKNAPYDLILIDGAVEAIPDTLAKQLAPGGRIIAAIDDRGVTRIVRGLASDYAIATVTLADVEAATLPGFERPKTFSFS